jgi:diguanylate cyclase (GGDEF)-like protein
MVAVLFCDLDDFKEVNDSLGHSVGDQVLVAVADRLRGCVRSADTPGRLGGDEFAILLEDLAGRQDADATADRIRNALEPPVVADGVEVSVQASIGVAIADERIRSTDELLREADLAMYATKAASKTRWFSSAADERLSDPSLPGGGERQRAVHRDLREPGAPVSRTASRSGSTAAGTM